MANGFDGLGDNRDQLGSGMLGKDFTGPQNEQEVIANEKKKAMSATNPSTVSIDPATASAMFGTNLGPQIAGIKTIGTSFKAYSNLAKRMNQGAFADQINKIQNPLIKVLAFGPVTGIMNDLSKFMAKRLYKSIVSGGTAIYDAQGNIVGAKTEDRGLIAGYDPSRAAPDADGSKENVGTFTAASTGQMMDTSTPDPTATSGSMAVASSYKARGPQDSSGSGRRSLFGKKV